MQGFFFIIIMNADDDFINILNEFYPFERYIVRTPKSIEPVFNDLILTEIFVPKKNDEVYVKMKGVAGEIRIGYFDFAPHIREAIGI